MTNEKPNLNGIPTGQQTEITPAILEISERFKSEGAELVKEIGAYIKTLEPRASNLFSSERTADEIIQSGNRTGCHESGLVMAALLRARGYSATYIQALDKTSVASIKDLNPKITGHVFIESEIDGKVVYVNSTTSEITSELPNRYMEGRRGLDSWDIGLRTQDDMAKLYLEKYREIYQ
jgi:hypothetical protein